MIDDIIIKLVKGDKISGVDIEHVMDEFIRNSCTDIEISSFLTALTIRGISDHDILAFVRSLKNNSLVFPTDINVFEICGTGGDKSNSLNISSITSIVVASGGIKTVKFGNRSSTSLCGSADFFEQAGINIDIDPINAVNSLENIGISFLFAQKYLNCYRHLSNVRHLLPFPTVFNIMGPLCTPAKVKSKVLGVYDKKYVVPLAKVLSLLGVENGMVVYGMDTLDEVSVSAPTIVCEFHDGHFQEYSIIPEQFGLKMHKKSDIIGGSPVYNVSVMNDIFRGKKGAPRDAILINAGCAFHIALGISIESGISKASELIDSGMALEKYEQWKRFMNKYSY